MKVPPRPGRRQTVQTHRHVVQLEGPRSPKPVDAGSSPAVPARGGGVAQLVEHLTFNQGASGSIPAAPTCGGVVGSGRRCTETRGRRLIPAQAGKAGEDPAPSCLWPCSSVGTRAVGYGPTGRGFKSLQGRHESPSSSGRTPALVAGNAGSTPVGTLSALSQSERRVAPGCPVRREAQIPTAWVGPCAGGVLGPR